VHVRGEDAHPLFRELARQSEAPGWNFYKYLVDREGKVVAAFPSGTAPDDKALRAAIEKLL
jgi:glutathione peroxidase